VHPGHAQPSTGINSNVAALTLIFTSLSRSKDKRGEYVCEGVLGVGGDWESATIKVTLSSSESPIGVDLRR